MVNLKTGWLLLLNLVVGNRPVAVSHMVLSWVKSAAEADIQKVHENGRHNHQRQRHFHMNLSQKSEAEILSIADPLMDNLMDASTHVDYERHVRDFTDRLKAQLPKERLESICREYQSTKGLFADRELVRLFRRPDSVAIVWKQCFTNQVGEFVAEMVLVQQDGKYLVDHVMVF